METVLFSAVILHDFSQKEHSSVCFFFPFGLLPKKYSMFSVVTVLNKHGPIISLFHALSYTIVLSSLTLIC